MTDRDHFLRHLLTHETRLRAYVGTLVRDVHAREDVFQDIALALWHAWPRFDAARPFGPWARGVATRQVLKAVRENRRFPCVFPPETIALIQEHFDRTDDTCPEREAALQLCVAALPDHAQQILTLRYAACLPCCDIAQQLGQSLDSIHQTLSRLRTRLADCIRRRLNRESILTP